MHISVLSLLLLTIAAYCNARTKIVGGIDAPPNRYPYYAFVSSTYFDQKSGDLVSYQCGGSLIYPDIVLTAAHCYPPQEDYVTYSATINFTNAEQLTGYEHLRQIRESLLFPEYNVSIPYLNDIMLLKLSSPVWEVEPLDINSDPNVPTDGQLMSVMGFGATYDSNVSDPNAILRFPEVLQEAELQVVGDEECFLQYGLESAINVPFILCAFAPEEAACRGDSGGPLIIERPSQSDLEVGIVSFGLDCASTGSTLFTQVSFYYEWIVEGICLASAVPPEYCNTTGGTPSPNHITLITTSPTTNESISPPTVSPVSRSPLVTPTTLSPTSTRPVEAEKPAAMPPFPESPTTPSSCSAIFLSGHLLCVSGTLLLVRMVAWWP